MPVYTFYTYATSALAYDGVSAFDLASDYDYTTDRFRFDVSDDDNVMNASGDTNQTAQVYTPGGTFVDSGLIAVTAYAELDDG